MAIFDQDMEQMGREELAQMQLERLQATLTRVYKNVTFYKKKFDEIGFLPEDCQSLEDLAACLSPPATIWPGPIPTRCLPSPSGRWCASTPPPAAPATPSSWATPAVTCATGPGCPPASSPPPGWTGTTWSR